MAQTKALVIAILAGAALLAVVGAAPAAAETVLCTEKTAECPASKTDGVGTEIKASLVAGTKSTFTGAQNIECAKSALTAKVTSTGKAIGASIEALTLEECNCEVKVLGKGALELEYIATTANATVKSTGAEITSTCSSIFGPIHCIYKTTATDLGTLEGGNPAKIKASAELPQLTTSGLCSSSPRWHVEYEVSSPKPLYIEPEAAPAETILCTEKTSPCPAGKVDGNSAEVKASLVSGVKSKLTTPYNNIECAKSSFTAKVTSTGEKVSSNVEALTFEECNCEVKVLGKGTLELAQISGTENATVKSTGTEITTLCSTIFGNVHCIYKTEATDLGTLEGGNPAKIKISGANIPRIATDTRCNEGAAWDAEYELTSPKPLYIEPEAVPASTILCTENATPCPVGKADGNGTEIKASLVAGTKSTFTSTQNIECAKSSLTAKVTSTGKTIAASVEGLILEECSCEVKVLGKGALELEHIAATANATVKSTGTEVTAQCSTIFGPVHCIYKTTATDLGTLEGGNPAKIKISAELPQVATSSLCSSSSRWHVEYEVTSPKPLYIEPE